jgi:hypothetical protein
VGELSNKGNISRHEAGRRGWPLVVEIGGGAARHGRCGVDEGTDKWGPLLNDCERRRRWRDAEA